MLLIQITPITATSAIAAGAGPTSEYACEAINLVDGKRPLPEVRDDVSAIYGPVPLETVAAYLDTLARIGVVRVGN